MSSLRNAEETLQLLKEGILKRRAYLRRRLEVIDDAIKKENEKRKADHKSNRGRSSDNYRCAKAVRGGMLSEIATISGMIESIETGRYHPDELYNIEDDPKEVC